MATFTPANSLGLSAFCSVSGKPQIVSADGSNRLTNEFFSVFTVADAPDQTAPKLIGHLPPASTSDVPIETYLAFKFDEAMQLQSAQEALIIIDLSSDQQIAGSYSWEGDLMYFYPSENLAKSSEHRVILMTTAEDLAGLALQQGTSFTFTTAANADENPPSVVGTYPVAEQTSVPINTAVTVSFSEKMDPVETIGALQIYEGTVDKGVILGGTATLMGGFVKFTPTELLKSNQVYTIVIGRDAPSGNDMFVVKVNVG